ncbi:MAG: LacI family DNA-binding transcriptional regulator [Alphaproteobacteria bacterium]|nr:LacI family DNA-binding transcriptional regulator [Alphaproteobacteria bacterium]
MADRDPAGSGKSAPVLRDVAQRAGVSVMTVSNVIRDRRDKVSEETWRRVLQAIEDTGYRPNRRGRSLRLQREFAIALTIIHPHERFLDDPYNTELAAGMSNALARRGYALVVNGAPKMQAMKDSLSDMSGVDGSAVMASGDQYNRRELYRLLSRDGRPLVVFQDRAPEDIADICAIRQDDAAGALDLAEVILQSGARSALFVGSTWPWPALEERCAAFRSKLAGRLRFETVAFEESSFSKLVEDLTLYFRAHGPPDALLGGNDQIAIAGMRAAERLGFAVPDDMSVTGYNAFAFREYVEPLLTSVQSPAYDIGAAAADALLTRLETGRFTERELVFGARLTMGRSVTMRP